MAKPKAIVAGDARAAYGGVMRAIDLVKRAGVEAIALENVAPTP
jgi:biopolymer transport protein ExbD